MGKRFRPVAPSGETASILVLGPPLSFARTVGVDVDSLLAELGLTAAELRDPDERIPEQTRVRAWDEASARARDVAFGLHVAEHTTLEDFDVLGYAFSFSTTLDDAFQRLATFHRLLSDVLAFHIEPRPDGVHARCVSTGLVGPSAEFLIAFLVLRARELTGRHIVPREVHFPKQAPADSSPHRALFGCPVHFDRAVARAVFHAADLDLPVRTARPRLAAVLDRTMRELLSRLPAAQDSYLQRVASAVSRSLRGGGRPTLETTARALKASPRTVQRHLTERGTSHRAVVDGARRELAVGLLETRRLSITETAFLLGFSDVSGFRRTFKRWTGRSPARARKPAS